MIINKDIYECPKCRKWYFFDTSKEYTAICEECKCNLTFLDNTDCNTELAEQRKNAPYYIPVVKCPYCQSIDTSKISAMSRVASTGLFGFGSKKIGKQYHCNKCKSDF